MTGARNESAAKSLSALGILNAGTVFWNLPSSHLYEHAVRAREGEIAHLGPMGVNTEPHTGRSPQDKFVVRDAERADTLWWGAHNNPFESTDFDGLFERLCVYLQERTLYSCKSSVVDAEDHIPEQGDEPAVAVIGEAQRVAIAREILPQPCLLYTSPSPRDATLSRMPSGA